MERSARCGFLCPARIGGFFILVLILCGVVAAEDPNPPSIRSDSGAWPIRRQWNRAETKHYAEWVENIFRLKTRGNVDQRCGKLERIITDPEMNLLLQPSFLGAESNPQIPLEVVRFINASVDCATFTAFMPAYYAYRRALPWMVTHIGSGGGPDIRTTPFNVPIGCASSFASPSLHQFFTEEVGGFSSGNYRINLNGRGSQLSDTAPVALNREYLMPGCINYVDGHCMILARITEYGELYFLNASTTQTHDIFTYNGMNVVAGITPRGSDPENEWNGCYQGLRVLRYPIAESDAHGNVTKVRRRTDAEMKEFGFSTEEYDAITEITEKHYISEGTLKAQSFHDLIRLRMKTVDTISPLKFMEEYADEILDAYKSREQFVQDAWHDFLQNGPVVYPERLADANIFQAKGRWETWSSPSSDVDRRNKYFYLADWLEYAIRWYGLLPKFVDLAGLEKYNIRSQADLAQALIDEKNRIFKEKSMEYTTSKGEKVKLTLSDIEQRLYDLSFDPNHPPELRWGAPLGSAERASAPETHTPAPSGARVPMEEAYSKEAFYRTLGQRETETSYLRDMFTEGYPIRDKLDAQLAKWSYATKPVVAEESQKKAEPQREQTPPATASSALESRASETETTQERPKADSRLPAPMRSGRPRQGHGQ